MATSRRDFLGTLAAAGAGAVASALPAEASMTRPSALAARPVSLRATRRTTSLRTREIPRASCTTRRST